MSQNIITWILIAIFLAGFLSFNFIKGKNYKIRNFIAEDNSFSFSYPEFKGWEVSNIQKSEETIPPTSYTLFFNNPTNIDFELSPQFTISVRTSKLATLPVGAIKNSNGIYYYDYNLKKADKITFQTAGFAVNITLNSISEKHGFSRKIFFEEIIKTFKQ